jgi:hypothetical protein
VKKKRIDSRTAAVIGCAAFGAVMIIALGVMLLSKHSQASKLSKQISSTTAEISAIDAQQASTQSANAIHVVDIYRLKKAMPDEVDMPDIIFELSRIASLHHIQFQGIQPGVPLPESNYQVLPVNVTFQGTYSQLTSFLQTVRDLVTVHHGFLGATGRLYTVDTLGFIEGKPSFPQIQATLTLDAYIYGSSAPVIGAIPSGTAQPASSGSTTTTSTTGTTTTTTTTTSSSADQTQPTTAQSTTPLAPAPTGSASALGTTP